MLLAIALILVKLTRYLGLQDDVYRLAIQATGVLSGLWGFAIAPLTAQLGLCILAFGWLQVKSLRT
jgi:hypothetical protein